MTKSGTFFLFMVLILGCEMRSSDTNKNADILKPVQAKYQAEQNYDWYPGTFTELTLVYIGANGCGPCHKLSFKNALEDLKVIMMERANEQNVEYSVIGIANDWEVQKGWDFLNTSGDFDEVIIGKNWVNSGSIEYLWDEELNRPSIPQVIIFERVVSAGQSYLRFGEKEYLARYSGTNNIEEWVNTGAKLEDI